MHVFVIHCANTFRDISLFHQTRFISFNFSLLHLNVISVLTDRAAILLADIIYSCFSKTKTEEYCSKDNSGQNLKHYLK